MRIEKNFPYKQCEHCLGCVIKTEEQVEWLNGHGVIVLTVKCKHDTYCQRVKKNEYEPEVKRSGN